MKDRFGVEITPGCIVTWPTRHGSSMYTFDGRVSIIDETGSEGARIYACGYENDDGRPWTGNPLDEEHYTTRIHRVTVVANAGL